MSGTSSDSELYASTEKLKWTRKLYQAAPPSVRPALRHGFNTARRMASKATTIAQRSVHTPANLLMRQKRAHRKLEIGPGPKRIAGFETLNIVGGRNVDYVWNAQRRLPFRSGSFEIVYASHILEHIPWYRVPAVLAEWVRILAPAGRLEIWVPNGLAICKAFVDAELAASKDFEQDGWYRFNPQHDPCVWAAGRVFSYGDGSGKPGHPNWHLALFSPRYLEQLLLEAGCSRVEPLSPAQVRGHDHGWINLGFAGIKG